MHAPSISLPPNDKEFQTSSPQGATMESVENWLESCDSKQKEMLIENLRAENQLLRAEIKTIKKNCACVGCEFCDRRFKTKRSLADHMRDDHLIKQPWSCTSCKKTFSSKFI